MKSTTILGVRIDKVNLSQAQTFIGQAIQAKKQTTVFTPNIEFLIEATRSEEFKKILNQASLNIPDSSRFGWLEEQLNESNPIKRFLRWWIFPFGGKLTGSSFPITTGIDLISSLAATQKYSFGLIGGRGDTAKKAANRLQTIYPRLKTIYAISGGIVNYDGRMSDSALQTTLPIINKKCDILLVGFGQGKQERWIKRFRSQAKAMVLIGCGGSLDYLAGNVARAPILLRFAGLEWLLRLIVQPWRIGRQLRIFRFILSLL